MHNFSTQSIGLSSVVNARDMGGYVLPGGVVRKGLLLRGGNLANVSDEDVAILRDRYHLVRVFDFRTSMEVKHSPDKQLDGVVNTWMPAFNEEKQQMERLALPSHAYRDLPHWVVEHGNEKRFQDLARDMYPSMVFNDFTQVQYAGLLQNILYSPEGSVYIHCSQGKDRTGLGAAYILAALGADEQTILNDYDISEEVYRDEVAAVCAGLATDEEKEVALTFIGANTRYFENALNQICDKYGNLEIFVRDALMFSEEDMQAFRNRYLDKI